MKNIFLLFVLQLLLAKSFGQLSPEQRIQDSVIGWGNINYFDNKIKPATDPIQKKRIEIDNTIVEWMKKSYTPVGGLGTFTRQNFTIIYGVYFMVWNVTFSKEYLDEKGHFKPVAEENTPFGISVNNIPASYSVKFLNGTGDYYFTWPPDGYFDWEKNKDADPKIHPNVYKHITRINELHTVFLAPNNKLPFVAITKGEYLNKSEEALGKELKNKKEEIDNHFSNTKSREDAYQYQLKQFERYRNAIQKWKEKYRDQLNEPAVLHNMQPTIITDFFGDMDPFAISAIEKNRKQYFPLYKVPADVMEKCKTAQPQWVAVWVRYKTKEDGNQLYEMYTAVTQNLNYEYIYNYFFDPEKVKGITYHPANEEQLNARLNSYRKRTTDATVASNTAKTNLPPNVIFLDEFAGSSEGGEPANWFFRRYGKHTVIAIPKNGTGKWLQLGAEPVSPTLLKKPLPQDFTLEYDLATDAEFSSSTGGAAGLILNTRSVNKDGSENIYEKGTRVNIDIQSGNDAELNSPNYRGNIKIDINSSPSVNKQNSSEGISFNYPLREFTNKNTTIHVTVKFKDDKLTLFINNKQVASSTDFKLTYGGSCISCGLPEGTRFNAVFWNNTTSDTENARVYISNIKITKD